jgi:hypothetical protein
VICVESVGIRIEYVKQLSVATSNRKFGHLLCNWTRKHSEGPIGLFAFLPFHTFRLNAPTASRDRTRVQGHPEAVREHCKQRNSRRSVGSSPVSRAQSAAQSV